jgi:hypothetical protein
MSLVGWAKLRRLPDVPHVEPGKKLGDYLFHIPNGGKRSKAEAGIFKAMGVKAGVSDLMLALPLHGYAGLWIEFKAPFTSSKDKNYPSKEQKEWLARMKQAGYATAVCYGWYEAQEVIEKYLGGTHEV